MSDPADLSKMLIPIVVAGALAALGFIFADAFTRIATVEKDVNTKSKYVERIDDNVSDIQDQEVRIRILRRDVDGLLPDRNSK